MPHNARIGWPLLLALLFVWIGCRDASTTSPDHGSTTARPDLATPTRYDFTLHLGTSADPTYIQGGGTIWAPCDTSGRGLPIGLHFDPPGPMTLRLDDRPISDSLRFIVAFPTAPCEPTDGLLASPIPVRWAGSAGDGLQIGNGAGKPTWTADHWPDRARTYLPVADHPSRASQWRFTIAAPSGYTVIASPSPDPDDNRAGATQTPDLRRTPRFDFPAKAVAWVAAPLVRVLDAGRIQAFASEQDAVAFARTVASAADVVRWMEAQIGPLPVDSLHIVRADTRFGGMENAGLIVLSGTPTGREAELLLAHEIAHQWFGTAASELLWRDLWLSEGAATWWAIRYGESRWGVEWADARRVGWGRGDVGKPADSTAHPTDLLADSYALGAARLEVLAREIGEEAMLRTMRQLARPDAHGARPVLSSKRLRRIAEEESGRVLAEVVSGW